MQKRLGLKECQNFLTFNTAKFLGKELADIQEKLKVLIERTPDESSKNRVIDASANAPDIDSLERRGGHIAKLLNRQVYMPREQNEYVSLGSGVRLLLNGQEKTLFVDSTYVGENKSIVSLNSPLGAEIFDKQQSDRGFYVANGRVIQFEILEILPYKEAKKILKPEERVLVVNTEPATTEAMSA